MRIQFFELTRKAESPNANLIKRIFDNRESIPKAELLKEVRERMACSLQNSYRIVNDAVKAKLIERIGKDFILVKSNNSQ